jgi:hypothetical protein
MSRWTMRAGAKQNAPTSAIHVFRDMLSLPTSVERPSCRLRADKESPQSRMPDANFSPPGDCRAHRSYLSQEKIDVSSIL